MFNKKRPTKTTIAINQSYQGETIEEKINRIVNNKEPINDGAPLIYTDRKDGVQPAYDIRTDRFDVAIDAMDKVTASHLAQREQRIGEKTYDTMSEEQQTEFHKKFPKNKHFKDSKKEGGAQSIQGTDSK